MLTAPAGGAYRRKMFGLIFLLTSAMLLAGCGRKGALVAPEALVPAAVSDLRVAQKGETFQVSWTRPEMEEGGEPLRDLSRFRLFRREVLKASEDCEQCPDAYRLIKEIDLDYLRGVYRLGGTFFWEDSDIFAGKTYQYKVVSVKSDGTTSRDSNRIRKKKVPPPPPPRLQITSAPTAVVLAWDLKPLKPGALLEGFNVYRTEHPGSASPLPLNSHPLANFRYIDENVIPEKEYFYVVRLVAQIDGEVAESGPSNEAAGRSIPSGKE